MLAMTIREIAMIKMITRIKTIMMTISKAMHVLRVLKISRPYQPTDHTWGGMALVQIILLVLSPNPCRFTINWKTLMLGQPVSTKIFEVFLKHLASQ